MKLNTKKQKSNAIENKFEVKADKYSVIENASMKTKGCGPIGTENKYYGGRVFK